MTRRGGVIIAMDFAAAEAIVSRLGQRSEACGTTERGKGRGEPPTILARTGLAAAIPGDLRGQRWPEIGG